MLDLNGLILHHRDFGYCKITGQAESTVRVNFISTNRDSWYGIPAIAAQKEFRWRPLPVGLKCAVPNRGTCTIIESAFKPSATSGVHEYLVAFDEEEGLTDRLSEREMRPIPGSLTETPKTRFLGLQSDPFNYFRVREGLRSSLRQLNQESDGISAMVGSRIELLPHQAYVVRNVVDDPLCRYILADEVGLGKTIEAGIIAHQLLADNPNARVLILTPGPLARQWLCEMRMSFVGRDFRLLDLHSPRNVSLKNWPLVISSLKVAMRSFKTHIQQGNWDLVIVDEAHQLLWSHQHYEFVKNLAEQAPRLLLLSAVPARERAEELLRLLRLIEPGRYAEGGVVATRFSELYAAQSTLGRRWRIFSRGIEKGDDVDLSQLHKDAQRLLSSPILEQDAELHAIYQQAIGASSTEDALNLYRALAEEVVARYRLSRRILKNRRSQLSEREMFHPVDRTVEFVEYAPSDLEQESEQLLLELLVSLAGQTQCDEPLYALTRKALQALCDSVALYEIASSMASGGDGGHDVPGEFDNSWVFDYAEHDELLSSLGDRYGTRLDPEKLQRWITLLRAAIDVTPQPRISALDSCLDALIADSSRKILVFAGTPGTAEFLSDHLKDRFGISSIASFRHDLTDDDKERQVAHFRNDPKCLILISDESGGEGRNFQISDCVVHFDLPWSVAAIEQRIGRLDRIGRTMPVRSVVIYAKGSIESQWVNCLADGFTVFKRSISGLEFMLRMQEQAVLQVVLESRVPDLQSMITQIFEASEVERAGDDAEAITDAASYKSRGYALRAFRPDIDAQLEQFLPGYMRSVSRADAARQVTDIKNANLKIWRLRPEDVTELKLPGLERDGDNPLRERFGTFDRLIARERQDLEFFSVGHPLVDALAHVMNHHVRGRSFFVSTASESLPSGIYVYCQWNVAFNESKVLIPERVKRLVATRSVSVAIDLHEQELLTEEASKVLTSMLVSTSHNFSDMGTEKAIDLLLPEQGEWSKTVNDLLEKSLAAAKEAYRQRYEHVDSVLTERWLHDIAYVERIHPDEAEEFASRQRQTIEALVNSRLELDVLGLIQIK
jgi:ATP-dependent helicase HepA